MTERAMRQASVDRYAAAPADLPTIQTCRVCGFLRYASLPCAGCEPDGAAQPRRMPAVRETHEHRPAARPAASAMKKRGAA